MNTKSSAHLEPDAKKTGNELENCRAVALKHSHIKYRSVFENSQLGISLATLDGWLIEANDAKLKTYGYTLEELKSMNLINLYQDPSDRYKVVQILKTQGFVRDFETNIIHKSGRIVHVSLNMNLLELDGQQIIQSTSIDLTDKKKTENLVIKSEAKYRELVENAASVILKIDKEGKIIFFNEYAENLFEYSQQEILGKKISGLLIPPTQMDYEHDPYQNMDCISPSGYYEFTKITEAVTKSGKRLWISWNTKPIYDEQNHMVGFISIGHNITQLKMMEENLKYAKEEADLANIVKSEFLANMSHEIRTPLNGVIGFTDILLRRESDPSKLEMLEFISESGKTLLKMINQILDLAKIESGKVEIEYKPFNLNDAFNQCVKMFGPTAFDKGIRIHSQFNNHIPVYISGDETRFKQVLINLVNNALKFTNKGSISVHATHSKVAGDFIFITFSVSDTGIGIPSDKIQKIFDRFYQVDLSITKKYGGAGLGLSIVKEILDKMGGTIKVYSEEGVGSKFVFDIPFKIVKSEANADLPVQNTKTSNPAVSKGFNILVAEDNHLGQILITQILSEIGHHIDIAENGMEVLQKIKENNYDLILMDIQMPVMDGLETTRQIRKAGLTTKIIALTANAMEGDKEACLNAGMDDYMSKPLDTQELYTKLEKIKCSI